MWRGTVNLRPWNADVVHVPTNNPYRGHRYPGEIHQSSGLAVLPVVGELPRCGRNDGDARCAVDPMKRSASGAISSVRTSPKNSAVGNKRKLDRRGTWVSERLAYSWR